MYLNDNFCKDRAYFKEQCIVRIHYFEGAGFESAVIEILLLELLEISVVLIDIFILDVEI